MSQMLFHIGVTSNDVVVEVQRGHLIAGFVGQTAAKTQEQIDKAKGGVFFLDEAYELVASDAGNDYGKEAIGRIMHAMTEPDGPVVICAGYPSHMADFIDSNDGLARRFYGGIFQFPSYSFEELAKITMLTIEKSAYKFPDLDAAQVLTHLITELTDENLVRTKINGGLAELIQNSAEKHLTSRVKKKYGILTNVSNDEMVTFTIEDIRQGIMASQALLVSLLASHDDAKQTLAYRPSAPVSSGGGGGGGGASTLAIGLCGVKQASLPATPACRPSAPVSSGGGGGGGSASTLVATPAYRPSAPVSSPAVRDLTEFCAIQLVL